jgi:hypothetical protein
MTHHADCSLLSKSQIQKKLTRKIPTAVNKYYYRSGVREVYFCPEWAVRRFSETFSTWYGVPQMPGPYTAGNVNIVSFWMYSYRTVIFTHIHTPIHTFTLTNTHTRTHRHTHTHTYTHIHTSTHTHTHIHIHARTHTRAHTNIHT